MKQGSTIQFLNDTQSPYKISVLTFFIAMLMGFTNPAWALRGRECGNAEPPEKPLKATDPRFRVYPGPIDSDNDGMLDDVDPCPYIARTKHEDSDRDGVGNICDPCPSIYGKYEGCPKSLVEISKRDVDPPKPLPDAKPLIDAKTEGCNVVNGPPSLFPLLSLLLLLILKVRNSTIDSNQIQQS